MPLSGDDWAKIRDGFPALRRWTYLNTATIGLMSNAVRAEVDAHFARREELANSDFSKWWDDVDELRELIAGLVHGAAADDIAFFPNASSALAQMLHGIDWRDGDEILTLTEEFPNQSYLGNRMAGVRLVETTPYGLLEQVTARTRLVALSTVNYQTGLRAPWEEMVNPLRERGVRMYVDATQSFGALVTQVSDAAPDVLAVDCYKWAGAPAGAAFAYVHPELRKRLDPLVVGWRSDAKWRDMHQLRHADPVFADAAEKYEGGMLAFPSLYGLRASLTMIEGIGDAAIEERVLSLARQCGGDGSSNIVLLETGDRDASVVAAELKQQGVLVSSRKGKLRLSPHFYNNAGDVARLLKALSSCYA